MRGDIPKFIDFIGVERIDLIIDSYLMNLIICMKTKKKEFYVAQLMTYKYGKKTRVLKYSKYLCQRILTYRVFVFLV